MRAHGTLDLVPKTPNYNGRRFTVVTNSDAGETTAATTFDYRQDGDVVWATYGGGGILRGTLVARVLDDGGLEMRYQHLNPALEFRCGTCRSRLEVLPDGRYRMHEQWQWTEPFTDRGESVVEEEQP
ncbi:MAG: n-acetylglutamate synthase [Acidobacteria bacterium]|nr:n-acetylglutamate synthase [Acidobacteriota bacterium]